MKFYNKSKINEAVNEVRSIWKFEKEPEPGEHFISDIYTLCIKENNSEKLKFTYFVKRYDEIISMCFDWDTFNNHMDKSKIRKVEGTEMKKLSEDNDMREKIKAKCINDFNIKLNEDQVTMCIMEMEEQRLSLFHSQIWPNKRIFKLDDGTFDTRIMWDPTIDGYRAIAHRSGFFGGIDLPEFSGDGESLVARVTVYRITADGRRFPIVGEARYSEFVKTIPEYRDGRKTGAQVAASQWANSPHNQLAIAAERQALRKGFQECGHKNDSAHVADIDKNDSPPMDNDIQDVNSDPIGNVEDYSVEVLDKYETPESAINKKQVSISVGEKFFGLEIVATSPSKKDKRYTWAKMSDGSRILFDHKGNDIKRAAPKASPTPESESPKKDDGATAPEHEDIVSMDEGQLRILCTPMMKDYCDNKIGKRISVKEIYKELTGVVLERGESMTVEDWRAMYECLTGELK